MHTYTSVRELTRRKAAGMTRDQVAQAIETARMHERLRSWCSDAPQDRAVIRGLEQTHEEWLRIAYVMCVEKMTTYQPDQDPGVQYFDAQRTRQTVAEAAARERASSKGLFCSNCGSVRST